MTQFARGKNTKGAGTARDEKSARQALVEESKRLNQAMQSGSWWHSIDLGGGHVTSGVHTLDHLRDKYAHWGLPDNLAGKRLLDIGCWDGFYSFEAERHGANVVSMDCFRPENYFAAHAALHSRAAFHEMSVYELRRKTLGAFDIVLFLGVLYHLRHPLLGLERVCEVTRDFAVIESHVIDDFYTAARPVMEFYEFEEMGGQYDNWWGPSCECLVQMIRAAGFARVEPLPRKLTRAAAFKAHRNWEPDPELESSPSILVPEIFNPVTWQKEVPTRGRNAFLGMYANGLPENVSRESLRVHVGSFGIMPYFVEDSQYPDYKQINAPVPPGLDPQTATVWLEIDKKKSNEADIELVEGSDW